MMEQQSSPIGEGTHPTSWSDDKLLEHCRLTFSRASGPGGQNRNKVETSVQIEYLPNHVIASASERRSQHENRKVALQRLRCKLALEIPWKPRVGSVELPKEPSDAKESERSATTWIASTTWMRYCRAGRIDIAESNTDWPTVLAEVIGVLVYYDWNLANAASNLGSSSSQLVKVLKKYPPAFGLLNRERKSRGQRPLD